MTTQDEIQETKTKLIQLCQTYIKERTQKLFEQHPKLSYFHYARYGEKQKYVSVNGIRWQDLDFLIHAVDFEKTRCGENEPINQVVQNTVKMMPDFKALRLACEDLYHVLADLTSCGIFNILGNAAFRILVTKTEVSYKSLENDETYPSADLSP